MVIANDHCDIDVNEVHAGRAARMLAAAFFDDPLMRFAFPDAPRRTSVTIGGEVRTG